MEIEADGDALHREPADEDARDEILGGKRGERLVEREHQRAVEPARREQPQLGRFVGEPEQRAVRAQEPPRMRLERQRDRRAAERFGATHRGGDHGAMTAVHAVEIADRDDAAFERGQGRGIVADHEERPRRSRRIAGLGRVKQGGQTVPPPRVPSQAGRRGTETMASPSSTKCPSTSASHLRRARLPSAMSSTTSTMIVTTSPIFTGAWKFSVCER